MKKLLTLLCLILSLPVWLFASSAGNVNNTSATITCANNTACFGNSITGISVKIKENKTYLSAFGNSSSSSAGGWIYEYDTIFLTAPSGFIFETDGTLGGTLGTPTDIVNNTTTISRNNDSIICVFSTNTTSNQDSIIISGFKLTPTSATAAGGTIGVKLVLFDDVAGSSSITYSDNVGTNFSMTVAPSFASFSNTTQTLMPGQPITTITADNVSEQCFTTSGTVTLAKSGESSILKDASINGNDLDLTLNPLNSGESYSGDYILTVPTSLGDQTATIPLSISVSSPTISITYDHGNSTYRGMKDTLSIQVSQTNSSTISPGDPTYSLWKTKNSTESEVSGLTFASGKLTYNFDTTYSYFIRATYTYSDASTRSFDKNLSDLNDYYYGPIISCLIPDNSNNKICTGESATVNVSADATTKNYNYSKQITITGLSGSSTSYGACSFSMQENTNYSVNVAFDYDKDGSYDDYTVTQSINSGTVNYWGDSIRISVDQTSIYEEGDAIPVSLDFCSANISSTDIWHLDAGETNWDNAHTYSNKINEEIELNIGDQVKGVEHGNTTNESETITITADFFQAPVITLAGLQSDEYYCNNGSAMLTYNIEQGCDKIDSLIVILVGDDKSVLQNLTKNTDYNANDTFTIALNEINTMYDTICLYVRVGDKVFYSDKILLDIASTGTSSSINEVGVFEVNQVANFTDVSDDGKIITFARGSAFDLGDHLENYEKYEDEYSFSCNTEGVIVAKQFLPYVAEAGDFPVFVARTSTNGCIDRDTVSVLVLTDLITCSDLVCYGETEETIVISVATLSANDERTYKTKFSSLEVTYANGDVVDGVDSLNTSTDDFIYYSFNPTEVYDNAPNISDEINIYFDMNAKVTYYAYSDVGISHTYTFDVYSYDYTYSSSSDRYYAYIKKDGIQIDYIYQTGESLSSIYAYVNTYMEDHYLGYIDDDYVEQESITQTYTYSRYYSSRKYLHQKYTVTVLSYPLAEAGSFISAMESEKTIIAAVDTTRIIDNIEAAYCPSFDSIQLYSGGTLDTINGYGFTTDAQGDWYFKPWMAYDSLQEKKQSSLIYSYRYLDANSCAVTKKDTISISYELADNSGSLTNLESSYCPLDDQIVLRSNMNRIDSIIGLGVDTVEGSLTFDPRRYYYSALAADSVIDKNFGLTEITDSVTLYYRDNDNCPYFTTKYVTVHARPQMEALSVEDLCEKDYTQFTQSMAVDQGSLSTLSWDFGDDYSLTKAAGTSSSASISMHNERTLGTYAAPQHQYATTGRFQVELSATSTEGCSNADTLNFIIGSYPNLVLTPDKYYNSEAVIFTNSSTVSESADSIASFSLDLDDAAGANSGLYNFDRTTETITHQFSNADVHQVQFSGSTQNGCTSDTTLFIPSFPLITVTDDSAYSTSFSDTAYSKGWWPGHAYEKTLTSGWTYRHVAASFVDEHHEAGEKMWFTGDSLTNEKSWLESPVFDISELSFPLLSLDIYQSLEPGRDGAVVQYTVNDGQSWQTLGSTDAGANWYNVQGVATQPGVVDANTDFNADAYGWSEAANAWQTARYPLDGIKDSLEDTGVRFRIAYSSNSYTDTASYKGFGVTNFNIGQRKRVALLESFICDAYEKIYNDEDDPYTDYEALNTFMDDHDTEVVDVRYPYSAMGFDDILYDDITWQDVSVRYDEVVVYGPLWVMDNVYRNLDDNGNAVDISYSEALEKRALVSPAWDFEVSYAIEDEQLKISAEATKISAAYDEQLGDHKIYFRFILVQDEMEDENGAIHENIAVEMLPTGVGNIAGIIKSSDVKVNESVSIEQSWRPQVRTIDHSYRFVIVAYAWKNGSVREVEQVWYDDLSVAYVPQTINGISTLVYDHLKVYPNPVKDKLYVQLPSGFEQGYYSLQSMSGVEVARGTITTANNQISTRTLATGLYLLKITDSKANVYSSKIVVSSE